MSIKMPKILQNAMFVLSFDRGSLQRGFSLVEALVALVVLGIGLMGIASVILLSHKTNTSNYIRQQAVQAAYDIIDRIRANRQAAINGNYNVSNLVTSGTPTLPSAPSTNCDSTSCSTTQLAAYDTWYWLSTNLAQLPNGCGSIATAASGTNTQITVTIQWNDSPTQQALGTQNPTPNQLIVQTLL